MPSNLAASTSLIQLLCSVAPVLVSTVSYCLHNFCLCASAAIAIYHCCICCTVEAGYPLQLLSQQHSTAVLGARTDSRRETSLPLYPVPGYPCKIPGALPGQSWGSTQGSTCGHLMLFGWLLGAALRGSKRLPVTCICAPCGHQCSESGW